MKRFACTVILASSLAWTLGATLAPSTSLAGTTVFEAGRPIHMFPARPSAQPQTVSPSTVTPPSVSCAEFPGGIEYHGGPVIHKALQKSLWWGPSGFDPDVQSHVSKFFGRFGRVRSTKRSLSTAIRWVSFRGRS
jgi:hypothetical protein